MPKSKRDRKVSLTRVQKKTRERKEELVETIRNCFDTYGHAWVVGLHNLRTKQLKEARLEWKGRCRLFMGKNKVMQVALGSDSQTAYRPNTQLLSNRLRGQVGLLFSNIPKAELEKDLVRHEKEEFARAGAIASRTVKIQTGDLPFQSTMEPVLRKLGLPTRLDNGVIKVEQDHVICNAGDVLNPTQTRLLKHLDVKLATFSIKLLAHWTEDKFEEFVPLGQEGGDEGAEMNDDDEDDDEEDDE